MFFLLSWLFHRTGGPTLQPDHELLVYSKLIRDFYRNQQQKNIDYAAFTAESALLRLHAELATFLLAVVYTPFVYILLSSPVNGTYFWGYRVPSLVCWNSHHKQLNRPRDLCEKVGFDHQQAPQSFPAFLPESCDPCVLLWKHSVSKQAPHFLRFSPWRTFISSIWTAYGTAEGFDNNICSECPHANPCSTTPCLTTRLGERKKEKKNEITPTITCNRYPCFIVFAKLFCFSQWERRKYNTEKPLSWKNPQTNQ